MPPGAEQRVLEANLLSRVGEHLSLGGNRRWYISGCSAGLVIGASRSQIRLVGTQTDLAGGGRSMDGERSSTRKMLQCLRRLPNSSQLAETIPRIIAAYKSDSEPWIVGYSGGKDSTAVVKLVFQSLLRVRDLL